MLHPSYTIIEELIKKHSPRLGVSILDYGCGNGTLLNTIDLEHIRSYVGLEVNSAALSVAKAKYKNFKKIQFVKINTKALPDFGPENSLDVVILVGVFQYLKPDEIEHVFKQSQKSLKKGGVLIASCVVDHWIYRVTNLYRLFLPNFYLNRKKLLDTAKKHSFKILMSQERGLIIGPFFSHFIVIFFDAIDKILFRNKGKLGPIGSFVRKLWKPIMYLEYKIPLDYGYTLFVVFQK